MNGNITRDGIRKDIEWMNRVGIVGFHIFDAGFDTPQIVEKRLPYMTPEWKDVFNYALDLADSLDMEVSITSSPGWSVTGGPWVSREDAMKKLVWSDTVVQGGNRLRLGLPQPPRVCGPYQDMCRYPKDAHRYDFYRDVAVVALRVAPEDLSMEEMGARVSWSGDRRQVLVELDRPYTIKSYMVAVDFRDRYNYARRLECSDDGVNFRTVVPRAPETVSRVNVYDIPPVKARFFRFCSNTAAPLSYSDIRLFGVRKVNAATEKAGFFASYSIRDFYPTPASEDASTEVVDITGYCRGGNLDWKAPGGRWRIYRFGYSLTGKCNGPASPEATGLEVDKLDREAVERYYRNYFKMYDEASGGRLGSVIGNLMIDSYEAECQNWTVRMPDEFRVRRGYSLVPWLPALAGEIIRSSEETERFLYDWRRTIEELTAESHYDAVDKLLKEYGMTRHTEAQEYSRVYNADGMDVRRNADVPMASFWMREFYSSYPCEEADMREAASVAHIYGQNVCGSESFTTNGEDTDCYGRRIAWTLHPGNLKAAADAAMASGLTRFIIHSTVHQPVDDKIPGLTLSRHGMCFNRHNTWAEEARPWTDYLSRSAYLLGQGCFAADIAVYYGETTNAVARFKQERPEVPFGHSYDFVNRTVVTELLKTDGSCLVTNSGMRYNALVIDREVRYMSLPVLRRIAEFARAGVLIAGDEPSDHCDLMGSGEEFKALVRDIWHSGRFNVVARSQLETALKSTGIPKDVDFRNPTGADIRFVHRHLDGGELYWLANLNPEYRRLEVSFNVYGKKPVLLDAETGRVEELSYRMKDGRTSVTLDMVPDDACFILFEEDTDAVSRDVKEKSPAGSFAVECDWSVKFQDGRGAPAAISLPELKDFSLSDESGVRYFSGTAVYTGKFNFEPGYGSYILDLGEVHDMARVILNGKDLGLLWKVPFRIDVTDAIRAGENTIEIRVTNTWHNRIIGDLQPDAPEHITYTVYKFYSADSPLRRTGLLGPVRIFCQTTVPETALFGLSKMMATQPE